MNRHGDLAVAPARADREPRRAHSLRDHFAHVLNLYTVSDLALVVSELVTNGVGHGRGTIQLAVEHSV